VKAHADDPQAARWGSFPTGTPDTEFRLRTRHDGREKLAVANLYATCSYCGSIDTKTAIAVLRTPGTHYSGSDWKYGWPHKFYLDVPCEPYRRLISSGPGPTDEQWGESQSRNLKFYAVHLKDATEEEMDQWESVAAPLLGVRYWLRSTDGEILYKAVYQGFQTWGYVDGVLTPGHHKSGLAHAAAAPVVPVSFLISPRPPIKPEVTP
jgi:hypothetical protein